MIEESAVDVNGNNLESITAVPLFKKTSSLIYLYTLRLRLEKNFHFEKENEKRTRSKA